MSRKQYTDCYTRTKLADVAASASNNGTVNTASFDTINCISPAFEVDVVSLAASKSISLKMQESDSSSSGFTDVESPATDLDSSAEIDSNGARQYYYAGDKRYIRLVVTSNDATVGATVRIFGKKDNLLEKPSLTSHA